MSESLKLFDAEEEPIASDFFKRLALWKHEGLAQELIKYLELRIKRDLMGLISANPADAAAIAQLQSRIDANATLRALITVDETVYDEEEEDA